MSFGMNIKVITCSIPFRFVLERLVKANDRPSCWWLTDLNCILANLAKTLRKFGGIPHIHEQLHNHCKV